MRCRSAVGAIVLCGLFAAAPLSHAQVNPPVFCNVRLTPQVSELVCVDGRVSDLSPLQVLPHLTSLRVDYNELTSLSPLAQHRELASLSVGGNPISDL